MSKPKLLFFPPHLLLWPFSTGQYCTLYSIQMAAPGVVNTIIITFHQESINYILLVSNQKLWHHPWLLLYSVWQLLTTSSTPILTEPHCLSHLIQSLVPAPNPKSTVRSDLKLLKISVRNCHSSPWNPPRASHLFQSNYLQGPGRHLALILPPSLTIAHWPSPWLSSAWNILAPNTHDLLSYFLQVFAQMAPSQGRLPEPTPAAIETPTALTVRSLLAALWFSWHTI